MRLGLVFVVGVALCATLEAAPRPGKVVRVERHAKRLFGTPRYCAFSVGDLQAYCYGKKPEICEHITVVDAHHVVGVVRVDNVDPLGSCPNAPTSLWLAHGQQESGDLVTPGDSAVGGLIDITTDPRMSHLVKVDRVPGDRPLTIDQVIAVDTDGDQNPDFEFLAFPCDDQGNPATGSSASTGQCLEVWVATGHTLEHLRTDRITQSCF